MYFFFFKQKTAYEMRISDWSSDVCSSDLQRGIAGHRNSLQAERPQRIERRDTFAQSAPQQRLPTGQADMGDTVEHHHARQLRDLLDRQHLRLRQPLRIDRKSVV